MVFVDFDSRRRFYCLVGDMYVPSSRDTDICKQSFLVYGPLSQVR